MSYYRVKLRELRSLQKRISKPAMRLVLIWLVLLAVMFAAPRWIDRYFTNHSKVISGINYYPFPIQIKLGDITKQIGPFDTYRWETWDMDEIELIALRMDNTEIGRRSWELDSTATSYLDIWSPGDTVTACVAHLDLTDFLYTGGERWANLGSIVNSTPSAHLSYTYPNAPVFQIVLDQAPKMPESTGTNVTVAGMFPVPCNAEFTNQQLNTIAEYWLQYDPEFAAAYYQQHLTGNVANLSYGTL